MDKQANRRNLLATLFTLFALAFLLPTPIHASEAKNERDTMKTITGSVWYRERIMLPPNAEVSVSLEDLSRMDVAAHLLASTTFVPQSCPPFDFSLEYDSTKLQEKGRYGLRVGIEKDGRLLFINKEHVPAFAQDGNAPVQIMVSQASGTHAKKDAPSAKPNASLTNTYWKLVELEDQPVPLGAGQKEVHMVLTSETNRIRGFSGCNQFTGSYKLKDKQLQFGPMAATMMACLEGMELEQDFLAALTGTKRFSIIGEILTLYSGEEQILRFESVYLQ